ncbi:hypothetical protein CLF_100200 [Clonorchis sinensis]|uniref:Uncharacterized protein n=1 Tax=Clonorchis sinensis TaxID=79923 RepID=G7Y2X1_CLOSI|nr:hypothetical protein CLF_100200 [Clonorchis sinensis]
MAVAARFTDADIPYRDKRNEFTLRPYTCSSLAKRLTLAKAAFKCFAINRDEVCKSTAKIEEQIDCQHSSARTKTLQVRTYIYVAASLNCTSHIAVQYKVFLAYRYQNPSHSSYDEDLVSSDAPALGQPSLVQKRKLLLTAKTSERSRWFARHFAQCLSKCTSCTKRKTDNQIYLSGRVKNMYDHSENSLTFLIKAE